MPRRIVFKLILITLARRYDDAGVNAGRSKRGKLVSAMLDLLPDLPPEIIDLYDLETESSSGLRIVGDRSKLSAEYHELCYPVTTNQ
ncbi:MAG: hypothetical protein WC451_06580 [Patescibacteria group bacterium]